MGLILISIQEPPVLQLYIINASSSSGSSFLISMSYYRFEILQRQQFVLLVRPFAGAAT